MQKEGTREGFQYTMYSECIVTCVCCQVLLNYIFICNVETNVSFLYGVKQVQRRVVCKSRQTVFLYKSKLLKCKQETTEKENKNCKIK